MPIIIIAAIVLLDQISKQLAITQLKPVISVPLIEGVLNFTYHENKGAFLGLFADSRWVFLITSTVAIIAMALYLIFVKNNHTLVVVALSMLIGGGIGNMIDRTVLGYVVDFVDFSLINFPIFNVADSFITIGAFLLIFYLIFFELKETKKAPVPNERDFDIPLSSHKENDSDNEQK